jgi:hypothetical protein
MLQSEENRYLVFDIGRSLQYDNYALQAVHNVLKCHEEELGCVFRGDGVIE